MPKIPRFLLFNSDRSGFKGFKIGMVKDGPFTVFPEEYDVPPPSKKSLGGEGDISMGEARSGPFTLGGIATPSGYDNPTVYLSGDGQISPSFTHPWMRLTGSNAAITITASPQIIAGAQNQLLALQCVDSSFTISNGTGVSLMGSGRLIMTSGVSVVLFYSTANNVWNEASRFRP